MTPTVVVPGYPTGAEICRTAGITYRQLDYWCRHGYLGDTLRGQGSGRARPFKAHHIPLAWALGRLSSIGYQGPPLARAASFLHDSSVITKGATVGFDAYGSPVRGPSLTTVPVVVVLNLNLAPGRTPTP